MWCLERGDVLGCLDVLSQRYLFVIIVMRIKWVEYLVCFVRVKELRCFFCDNEVNCFFMEYEQKCLDRDWDKKCCDWDRGYDQDNDLDYDWIMIRQSYFNFVYI